MDNNQTLCKKDNIEVTLGFEMVPMTNAFHDPSAKDKAPRKKRRAADRILPIIGVATALVIGSTFVS